MTDPDPIPGTPEAAFRARLAELEAEGAMEYRRPRPTRGQRWGDVALAALALAATVAFSLGAIRLGAIVYAWLDPS